MALAKYGGIISELRGKEAGVIFSRNAYGSYMKQKVSPVNPQTQKQLDQRTLMGNMAQVWAGLTSAEKASWDNLGAQVTRVNRFGDTTNYTGFSIFMKLNRNIVLVGGTALDEAPTMPEIPVLTLTSLVVDLTVPVANLSFTPTVPTGFAMVVYFTNNILTGRRFVKNFYRLITTVAAAQTSPQELSVQWLAYFQNSFIEGAGIFCKAKLIHVATGFEGVPATINTVVVP